MHAAPMFEGLKAVQNHHHVLSFCVVLTKSRRFDLETRVSVRTSPIHSDRQASTYRRVLDRV